MSIFLNELLYLVMNDDNVIATIYHVRRKQKWRSGDTVMLMQPIEIVVEQTNEFISLDASEITHLFWDRLTDKRFGNNSFNIKNENASLPSSPLKPKSPIFYMPDPVPSPTNEQADHSESHNYNPKDALTWIEQNYVSCLTSDESENETG